MRGSDGMQEALFTVSKLEDFVPTDHPLRAVRWLVNEALVRQPSQTNQVQSIWFSGLGSANAAAGGGTREAAVRVTARADQAANWRRFHHLFVASSAGRFPKLSRTTIAFFHHG